MAELPEQYRQSKLDCHRVPSEAAVSRNPSSRHLYSVGAKDGQGGIAAFDQAGQLLNHVVEEGAPLCYVAVDEERDLVYGANYHKGQVLVYKRLANGRLELADSATHQGQGPHANQASAHVHYADLTPDQYLVTCDLGTDEVTTYDVRTLCSLAVR